MNHISKTLDQQTLPGNVSIPVNFEPPQYADIDLTLEETEAACEEAKRQARERKYFALKREKYYSKVLKDPEIITRTAEELFEEFKKSFKLVDEIHERKIKQLCCYFANDKRFNGDLTKGLLIMGNIGNGKTTVMKFFAMNQNFSFRMETMLDISFDYKMAGEKGVEHYSNNFTASPNIFGKSNFGYCFDDLGTEEIPCRHFAESKNIFSEIIQVRYHNQLPFNSTHATTNLSEKELREAYGNRSYDRMKEMFNVIVFENESFR